MADSTEIQTRKIECDVCGETDTCAVFLLRDEREVNLCRACMDRGHKAVSNRISYELWND